jgi:peptidoglycan-N-acetylglucosamine deacetylase
MWLAGIAWDADGWDLAVLDVAGHQVMPPRRYGTAELASLLAHVIELSGRAGRQLTAVVDSTNGLTDRSLVEAGVEVVRADPWDLPPRTRMGSVPASALALAARDRLPSLARLSLLSGIMHGRDEEQSACADGSAALAARLSREGRYLTRGPADQPQVALTFDDGPDPRHTPRVLETLGRYGAVATFFCVGAAARAHPDLLSRAAREGHLVANHTWSHPFLPDLSREELRWQIEATGSALAAAAGQAAMPGLVRPPYGASTPETLGWLAAEDATTVLWDVDTNDWRLPGPDAITEQAVHGARNGSIVLFHDGGGDRSQTTAALPEVIAGLGIPPGDGDTASLIAARPRVPGSRRIQRAEKPPSIASVAPVM